jgi:hypothetical protein
VVDKVYNLWWTLRDLKGSSEIAGIIEMRHGMWEKVAKRSHKPSKIYSFGKDSYDVMLHGTVDYELKDGKKADDIEWSARAIFAAEDGSLKMKFYQVYLVSHRLLWIQCLQVLIPD